MGGGNEKRKSDHPLQRAIVQGSGSRQRPTSSSGPFVNSSKSQEKRFCLCPLTAISAFLIIALSSGLSFSHPYTASDCGHDPFFSTPLLHSASREFPRRLGTREFLTLLWRKEVVLCLESLLQAVRICEFVDTAAMPPHPIPEKPK